MVATAPLLNFSAVCDVVRTYLMEIQIVFSSSHMSPRVTAQHKPRAVVVRARALSAGVVRGVWSHTAARRSVGTDWPLPFPECTTRV